MSVSRKCKSIKKSRSYKKQNKKTRKHVRKMKGGTHEEIRNYLRDNFDTIYGENPFRNTQNNQNYTEEQKSSMIEDVMNAINVISKKAIKINNKNDFINFIKEYQNDELLQNMFDAVVIDHFKNL